MAPEFDPTTKHVFDHAGPPAHLVREWAVGMDFGFRAPTAILWCALTHAGEVFVMDERVLAGVILDEHIDAIRAGLAREGIPGWPPPAFIAPDPAGFQVSDQTGTAPNLLLHRHGYPTRISHSGVIEGLNLVRARLSPATGEPPRLYVHARCVRLIESLEKYHFNPRLPEDPKPMKDGYDHPIDALRYLVTVLDKPCRTTVKDYRE